MGRVGSAAKACTFWAAEVATCKKTIAGVSLLSVIGRNRILLGIFKPRNHPAEWAVTVNRLYRSVNFRAEKKKPALFKETKMMILVRDE